MMILNLNVDVLGAILSDWLLVMDLQKLSCAFCRHEERADLESLLRSPKHVFEKVFAKEGHHLEVNWTMRMGICVRKFSYWGGRTLADPAAFGVLIKSAETVREIDFASRTECDLIRFRDLLDSFVNLEVLSIDGPIPGSDSAPAFPPLVKLHTLTVCQYLADRVFLFQMMHRVPNLTHLNLESMHHEHGQPVEPLPLMPKLATLRTQRTDELFPFIHLAPNLRTLQCYQYLDSELDDMKCCPVNISLLFDHAVLLTRFLSRCSALESFEARNGCRFDDASLRELKRNGKTLRVLNIVAEVGCGSALSDMLATAASGLTKLELEYHGDQWADCLNSLVTHGRTSLTYVCLSVLQDHDEALVQLIDCSPALNNFQLMNYDGDGDALLAALTGRPRIKRIALTRTTNASDGAVLSLLSSCRDLKYLDLHSSNQLSDAVLIAAARHGSLYHLALSASRLSGGGVSALASPDCSLEEVRIKRGSSRASIVKAVEEVLRTKKIHFTMF